MARQYILAGFPTPIFINETTSLQYSLPGVYLDETSGAAPPAGGDHLLLPLLMVGRWKPQGIGTERRRLHFPERRDPLKP